MGDYQHDKRICVYPAYLNSTLTVAQGRKIPAYLATENPSAHEVYESAMRLGLKCQLEDKSYPRDYMVRGRIRVELTNEDGTAANEKCPTRRYLLIELAKMVPTTMARKKRGEANTIGEPIVQSFMSPKEEKQAEKDKAKAKGGKKKK